MFSEGLNEGVKRDVAKDEQKLYEALYGVLKRESRETLNTLIQVYGLGTDAPSKFGLSIVSRMRFREACPFVVQSDEIVKQSSADFFRAPREEIQSTLREVECR